MKQNINSKQKFGIYGSRRILNYHILFKTFTHTHAVHCSYEYGTLTRLIDSFSDFEANIFYVEKKDDEYLIYLGGKTVTYYEVDGEIYDNIDGNPAISGDAGVGWKAYAVSTMWNGNEFTNESIIEYQLGKEGTEKIFEEMPKPVAMMITGGAAGEMKTSEVIEKRSLLKACAHFGAVPSVDKRIGYVIERNAVEVYTLDFLYEDGEIIEDKPIKVIRTGDK